jgi:CubicO group peptidase (beta-lactamase class C family)
MVLKNPRSFAFCALLLGVACWTEAQSLYFPPLTGSAWDTVSPSALGWSTTSIDTLRDFLAANNTRAFIVLKDGRIAIEQYFGTFGRDSAWYWASAGKSLTAFLVGIAQQEGSLSLQDTSSRWLGKGWTSSAPAKEDLITVRHQLTMTTGLNDGVADPYCTESSCLTYLADPGTRWAYHNAPYTLLDSVLRSATGLTPTQFFMTRVAIKSGMTGLYIRSGYNNVFVSTARSMARFGLLILNRGAWGATPILTDTAYFRAMVNSSQSLNPSYGYLWWLNGKPSYMLPQTQFVFPGPLNPSAPQDMIAALGKNGQFINVVPSMNLVFVRIGDAPDSSLVPFTLNEMIWERLNRVFSPVSVEIGPDAGSPPEDLLLYQNYPNPFNPTTIIRYQLTAPGTVRLAVYDLLGREAALLVNEAKAPGRYEVRFDAAGLASGVYLCRLTAGNQPAGLSGDPGAAGLSRRSLRTRAMLLVR